MYALRALDEGVLFFPLYALLFADAGLSAAQITSLFVLWSVVTMAFEVPSGAWADVYPRHRLLALAGLLRAIGFALWMLFPTYWAFAAGFVLWGARSALASGTQEALFYDELSAIGATDRYPGLLGRAQTMAIGANLSATALAAPVLAIGGFRLVGAASVAVCLASAAVALSFPPRPRATTAGPHEYFAALRRGLVEISKNPRVRHAVLIAAGMGGLTALDDYLPLLARTLVGRAAYVPLLLLLPLVAMTLGALAATRWSGLRAGRLAGLMAVGAGLLAAGSLVHTAWGFVGVAACFGAVQLGIVLSNARLQQTMTGSARATVLSVSGVGTEVAALAIYGGYGLGSLWLPASVLIAGAALPLWIIAAAVPRWLPDTGTISCTCFGGDHAYCELHPAASEPGA